MVSKGYVDSLIASAEREAREGILRIMRHDYPCPVCGGSCIAPDAELTTAGFLDDAADCPACQGTGIAYDPARIS